MLTEVGRVGARLHHMMGDLHPHGQNSPDIPMSSIQNFFTLRFYFRRDIEWLDPRLPNWDMGTRLDSLEGSPFM